MQVNCCISLVISVKIHFSETWNSFQLVFPNARGRRAFFLTEQRGVVRAIDRRPGDCLARDMAQRWRFQFFQGRPGNGRRHYWRRRIRGQGLGFGMMKLPAVVAAVAVAQRGQGTDRNGVSDTAKEVVKADLALIRF